MIISIALFLKLISIMEEVIMYREEGKERGRERKKENEMHIIKSAYC